MRRMTGGVLPPTTEEIKDIAEKNHFSLDDESEATDRYYYYWTIQRIGAATGYRTFNGIDWYPTLLELAGITPPPGFEGTSLLPLLAGTAVADRPSYAGLGQPLFFDARVQRSLTDGEWTYARDVESEAQPRELLFDRALDAGENVNLIDLEPEQAHRMRERMDDYLAGRRDEEALETEVRIDPGIAGRLRALGYLR